MWLSVGVVIGVLAVICGALWGFNKMFGRSFHSTGVGNPYRSHDPRFL